MGKYYELYLYEAEKVVEVEVKKFRKTEAETFSKVGGADNNIVRNIGVIDIGKYGYDYAVVAQVDELGHIMGFHPMTLSTCSDSKETLIPYYLKNIKRDTLPVQLEFEF